MHRYQHLVYGMTVVLGSLLLVGCNSGTTSSSVSISDNITQLLTTNECEGCDLSGADLSNANLRSAKLKYANLRKAKLAWANLYRADLYFSNLRHADLQNANLQDADLKHAEMQYANLTDADLTGADMHAGESDHFDTDLKHATWTDGTTCVSMSCDGKAY